MPARYVHLSGKDAEDAILQLHGIKNDSEQSSVAKMKSCPRCGEQSTPEIKRCLGCGFILDEKLLAEVSMKQETEIANIISRLEKLESLGEKMDKIIEDLMEKRN
jgi:ribosomal protein L37E